MMAGLSLGEKKRNFSANVKMWSWQRVLVKGPLIVSEEGMFVTSV